MCGLAFRARWFGSDEEKALMDISDRESIIWGSYFEQLIFGSGVGGKTIDLADLGSKHKKNYLGSVFYKRVKSQAETARGFIFEYLKSQGYPFWTAQYQLITTFFIDGINVPYEGNADGMFGSPNKPTLILDTKSTADTTNTFGKYAWGKPEQMDMGQLAGYTKASEQIFQIKRPEAMYYVADLKEEERVEPIHVEFSDSYIDYYLYDLKESYIQIKQSLSFNYWPHKASYNNCSKCPIKNICTSAIKIPEIKTVYK